MTLVTLPPLPPTYFTLAQYIALQQAYASGVLSVSYEGKSTTFRSMDEMLRALDFIGRALGIIPRRSSTVLVAHDRGYFDRGLGGEE
jgi:hypothetical protein